jgi:hypothetical protein
MADMNAELKPCVVGALENFDYPTRVLALRLLGCGDQISSALDDTIANPKLREVLRCLAGMAWAGLLENYGGWDTESAGWTLSREHALAEDLANIEAQIENLERTTTLTARKNVDLTPQQIELAQMRAQWEVDAPPPPRLSLPPGVRPSMATLRGLALLRQRAARE